MEAFPLTESEFVNSWIRLGYARGVVLSQQHCLLVLLARRFPGEIPSDVTAIIKQQDNTERLDQWFDSAITAPTFADFVALFMQ